MSSRKELDRARGNAQRVQGRIRDLLSDAGIAASTLGQCLISSELPPLSSSIDADVFRPTGQTNEVGRAVLAVLGNFAAQTLVQRDGMNSDELTRQLTHTILRAQNCARQVHNLRAFQNERVYLAGLTLLKGKLQHGSAPMLPAPRARRGLSSGWGAADAPVAALSVQLEHIDFAEGRAPRRRLPPMGYQGGAVGGAGAAESAPPPQARDVVARRLVFQDTARPRQKYIDIAVAREAAMDHIKMQFVRKGRHVAQQFESSLVAIETALARWKRALDKIMYQISERLQDMAEGVFGAVPGAQELWSPLVPAEVNVTGLDRHLRLVLKYAWTAANEAHALWSTAEMHGVHGVKTLPQMVQAAAVYDWMRAAAREFAAMPKVGTISSRDLIDRTPYKK